MQPTDMLTVTLEANAWNTILQMLVEQPYRVAAHLIQAIQAQCLVGQAQYAEPVLGSQAGSQDPVQDTPGPPPINGHEHGHAG